MGKKKQHKPVYRPWFPDDEILGDKEEQDNWIRYIQRSLHRQLGEGSPFPYSEWSYMHEDSPFDVEKKSDTYLHYEIQNALYSSPDLDASDVNLLVYNGVVHLSGTVETAKEKNIAENIVKTIRGVWKIENELLIEKHQAKNFGLFS